MSQPNGSLILEDLFVNYKNKIGQRVLINTAGINNPNLTLSSFSGSVEEKSTYSWSSSGILQAFMALEDFNLLVDIPPATRATSSFRGHCGKGFAREEGPILMLGFLGSATNSRSSHLTHEVQGTKHNSNPEGLEAQPCNSSADRGKDPTTDLGQCQCGHVQFPSAQRSTSHILHIENGRVGEL